MLRFAGMRFGADPELFLIDQEGKFISSIGKIGGTKQAPLPIDDKGSAVQEDNVAVEFNIAPSANAAEFIENLQRPLSYLEEKAKGMGLGLSVIPSAIFTDEELTHPQARMFGCDVDYNVWTGKPNPRPKAKGIFQNLRTAGGHVHVSWNEPDMKDRVKLVQALDLFLGVPSVLMDGDTRRRLLYGKAGAYRPKIYGVEYRVLSNFWIKDTGLMRWVVQQTENAVEFLRLGNRITSATKKSILQAINESSEQAALRLVDEFNIRMAA